MARYIDIETAVEAIRREFKIYHDIPCSSYDKHVQDIVGRAIRIIRKQPPADVAPRSEMAREIFGEIDKRFEALLESYPCNGEFEDAKSFVNFHWKYIRHSIMRDYDAELKQKYTEEQK